MGATEELTFPERLSLKLAEIRRELPDFANAYSEEDLVVKLKLAVLKEMYKEQLERCSISDRWFGRALTQDVAAE